MLMKIEETEQNALKGGAKIVNKLELQLKSLENNLESEQRRQADVAKSYSKADRRLREIQFQVMLLLTKIWIFRWMKSEKII